MPERNWGQIRSGATFESLATTLVFFEDSGAALFGRRGKDGGQDARSSDGKRVFQAKYHQDGSASKAIADAKKEAAKIAKYRSSGHSREPQWRGVTHWRLVINAAFNPTDRQTWDNKVVPLFSDQGLIADYWEQANLDALLDKHPEVDRAYFQNATRSFLSLPEVTEMLPLQEPFLQRDALGPFVGRDAEGQKIRSFLASNHLFLVVYGAGGVGKTRFVVEAGEQVAGEGSWQVLWANVASMEASGTWFEGIVPERPTLLIVDEPESDRILHVLAEQLRSRFGRTSQWKIAITVRSPKDPVLKFLFRSRMKPSVDKLPVSPLPHGDAESMCKHLMASGPLAGNREDWKRSTAKELAKGFSCYPVWLTLAVHALEKSDDLAQVPQSAADLAEDYLSEVVERQSDYSPETVTALLRSVALVGTLNREDDTVVQLVAEEAELNDLESARKAMARLVERRALAQRGGRNRFVEVKPNVVRDHLLRNWLSVDVGFGPDAIQASNDAESLAQKVLEEALRGSLSAVGTAILKSLARTELVLRLSAQPVDLLSTFVKGVLPKVSAANPSTRIAIAETFVELAAFRPDDTVELSQKLRESPCTTERIAGLFGEREVGRDDVLLELAWPVFHAAFGAQTAEVRERVLTELCKLAEVEACIEGRPSQGLPNDGKRAKDLIGRALEGGPQFWSDFEDAASVVGTRLLEQTAERSPSRSRRQVLKALLEPAMSVERWQTWSEDYTFHIQTSTILPGHPAWATREALKGKVKILLEDDATPPDSRAALWPLFAEAHRSVNQCHGRGPQDAQTRMRQEMLEDLSWAHSVLSRRTSHLGEMSAARDLWHWHVQFERDVELLKAAQKLESLYESNDLAAEFKFLLSRDEWEARGDRARQKANELAGGGREGIEAFLERARAFFDNEQELYQAFNVAWHLGAGADESPGVQEFVRNALADAEVSPRTNFAAIAVNGWVSERRKTGSPAATTLAAELVQGCGSPRQRINLLVRLYGQLPRPKDLGDPSDDEYRFVRSQEQLFVDAARGPSFVACVGWGIEFDWKNLKAILERVLDVVPGDEMFAALDTLVDALLWAVQDRATEELPDDLGVWMLDQLIRIPDVDKLGGNLEWHIGEVLKRVGLAPLTWLPGALERRRLLEADHGHGDVQALSHHMRLSRFVMSIDQTAAITPDVEDSVGKLLEFVSDAGSVGYYLHGVLRDVDPHGRVVPELVARRFAESDDQDMRWRLARIGGAFTIGSAGWRTIAKSVLARAAAAGTPEERSSLYASLTERGPRSWSGTPGEVPAIFTAAVESARKRLEAEADDVFRPFWKWRLAAAEAELRDQEEHAKEERGE